MPQGSRLMAHASSYVAQGSQPMDKEIWRWGQGPGWPSAKHGREPWALSHEPSIIRLLRTQTHTEQGKHEPWAMGFVWAIGFVWTMSHEPLIINNRLIKELFNSEISPYLHIFDSSFLHLLIASFPHLFILFFNFFVPSFLRYLTRSFLRFFVSVFLRFSVCLLLRLPTCSFLYFFLPSRLYFCRLSVLRFFHYSFLHFWRLISSYLNYGISSNFYFFIS